MILLIVAPAAAVSPWLMLGLGACLFVGGVAVIVTGKRRDRE